MILVSYLVGPSEPKCNLVHNVHKTVYIAAKKQLLLSQHVPLLT